MQNEPNLPVEQEIMQTDNPVMHEEGLLKIQHAFLAS